MAPDCLVVEIHFVGDYRAAPVQLPALASDRLEGLIDALARQREPVSATQLADYLDGRGDIPQHSFLLTFDDGIRDHATVVADILTRKNLTGAFFVPGSIFAKGGRLPLLERQRFLQYAFVDYQGFLDRFIAQAAAAAAVAPEVLACTPENRARMGDYLAEFSFYTSAERYYRFLRDRVLSATAFETAIDLLFAERFGDGHALMQTYYLGPDDLRHLTSIGMEIGGHGYSHQHLPRLDDQRADILAGMTTLEEITGLRPRIMAYPYGSYDTRTVTVMGELDFRLAFRGGNQIAAIDQANRFSLPRVDVADAVRDLGI